MRGIAVDARIAQREIAVLGEDAAPEPAAGPPARRSAAGRGVPGDLQARERRRRVLLETDRTAERIGELGAVVADAVGRPGDGLVVVEHEIGPRDVDVQREEAAAEGIATHVDAAAAERLIGLEAHVVQDPVRSIPRRRRRGERHRASRATPALLIVGVGPDHLVVAEDRVTDGHRRMLGKEPTAVRERPVEDSARRRRRHAVLDGEAVELDARGADVHASLDAHAAAEAAAVEDGGARIAVPRLPIGRVEAAEQDDAPKQDARHGLVRDVARRAVVEVVVRAGRDLDRRGGVLRDHPVDDELDRVARRVRRSAGGAVDAARGDVVGRAREADADTLPFAAPQRVPPALSPPTALRDALLDHGGTGELALPRTATRGGVDVGDGGTHDEQEGEQRAGHA